MNDTSIIQEQELRVLEQASLASHATTSRDVSHVGDRAALPHGEQDIETGDDNGATTPTHDGTDQRIYLRCDACEEVTPDAVVPNCMHAYCPACVRFIFERSITDPSYFPPSCCGGTRIPLVRHLFDDAFLAAFQAKAAEYDQSEHNHPNSIHCSNATCDSVVPRRYIMGSLATCQSCNGETCTICGQAAHSISRCPEDPSTRTFLHKAATEGWTRCRRCNFWVAPAEGCNHIM